MIALRGYYDRLAFRGYWPFADAAPPTPTPTLGEACVTVIASACSVALVASAASCASVNASADVATVNQTASVRVLHEC